jgi:hypothetical protein
VPFLSRTSYWLSVSRFIVFFPNAISSVLKQVIEGNIKEEMEVTKRRGRRRKKLLDDLKERRGYSNLKEEALDRAMWRNRFGGGFEPVVRQNTE